MNIEKIYFKTEDKVELFGLMHSPKKKTKKIIIAVHGMSSSCFKKRDDILATEFTKKYISYFAFNNRGHDYISKYKEDEKSKIGGSIYESIYDSYYDIKAAIDVCVKKGYREIYMQGHSLGCLKIVYTLNKLKNEKSKLLEHINKIILLSPVDTVNLQKYYLKDEFNKVLEFAKNTKEELMPKQTFFKPISTKTFLELLTNEDLNLFRYSDNNYNYKEINNIEKPVIFAWGTDNEMLLENPNDLEKILKEKIQKDIQVKAIKGANHSYKGHEKKLAKYILDNLN